MEVNRISEIAIDGSYGEGGGQILRVSIALSAVTGKPVKIYNIRAKRSPPGLRTQHATAVKAVAQLDDAEARGLKGGSSDVSFYPKSPKAGDFIFDAGTAASTTLILQSLMPAMAFSPGRVSVEVRGGTNAHWAPVVDYLQGVLLPTLSKMGLKGNVTLIRRGFYPRGGGVVKAFVEPVKKLQPIVLTDFGEVKRISGLAYSSRLPSHVVERMVRSAEQTLKRRAMGTLRSCQRIFKLDTLDARLMLAVGSSCLQSSPQALLLRVIAWERWENQQKRLEEKPR